jgi:asparagine synthase (glutamine-hydrolysing)
LNFGFLVRWDKQGVRCHQYGEGPAGAQNLLSTASDESGSVVFLGRLYYLDDLRRRFRECYPEPTPCPAECVLTAFRKAGVEGLTWLEGDYAFALWDARNRRLLAARDPFGGFPLFWVQDGNAVVVSTVMRPLLDLLPHRIINRDYLAEFLLQLGVQDPQDERCAYEGVHRVLAGSLLEVCPGGVVRASRWWDWEARVEQPTSLRPEDIAERCGTLLKEAVRQRRVGRTAAALSGGMDSTAVALLAARQAHAAGDEPVHGLSLIYERLPVLARETPYVDCVPGEPGLQRHRLPGDDYLEFDALGHEMIPDEPQPWLWQQAAVHASVEYAAQLGARTLMTGLGADELFCMLPYHLPELLRSGRWLAAWRESARWGKAGGNSRWFYLWPYGLAHFVPLMLRGGLGCWWRGGLVGWEQQGDCTIPPWVRPEFARRFELWPRAIERLRQRYNRNRSSSVALLIEMLMLTVGDIFRWEVAVPRGLMIVHPYRDPRLARYCLGWRGCIWPDPERQKPILADAMRDILPAAIRQRRRKGHFEEFVYTGLARNRASLEALVERAPVDDLDLLDRSELLRCLRNAALGVVRKSVGRDRLCHTLGMLKWLSLQERWLQAAPASSKVIWESRWHAGVADDAPRAVATRCA